MSDSRGESDFDEATSLCGLAAEVGEPNLMMRLC